MFKIITLVHMKVLDSVAFHLLLSQWKNLIFPFMSCLVALVSAMLFGH